MSSDEIAMIAGPVARLLAVFTLGLVFWFYSGVSLRNGVL